MLDTSLNSGYFQPMKIGSRPCFRKPKLNLESQMFTLSNAKTYLGRLMENAKMHRPGIRERLNLDGFKRRYSRISGIAK